MAKTCDVACRAITCKRIYMAKTCDVACRANICKRIGLSSTGDVALTTRTWRAGTIALIHGP